MKYIKRYSLDRDYQHYLGEIGGFGLMFGHKVSLPLRRKANYIWKSLCKQYGI